MQTVEITPSTTEIKIGALCNKIYPCVILIGVTIALFFTGLFTNPETKIGPVIPVTGIAITMFGIALWVLAKNSSWFIITWGIFGGWMFAYIAGYCFVEPVEYSHAILSIATSFLLLLAGCATIKHA